MDLYDTSLPTIEIERRQLRKKYKQIGHGGEAYIFRYDEKTALKYFEFFKDDMLALKFKKIEVIGHFRDDGACFPEGFFGFEDRKKEGCFLELVEKHPIFPDFIWLQFLKDKKKLLEFVMKADGIMQRLHKLGFIIGDVRGENILIDKDGNVKFVDTDNYAYGDFGFDVIPDRTLWLARTFGDNKKFTLLDSDKYVFAMMVLQYFVKESLLEIVASDNNYFMRLIERLNVDPVIKEGLRLIFSDAENKPYIGDVLRGFEPESKIFCL